MPDVAVTRREAEPDLKMKLARAIDALPDGYRMVFVMHDVGGLHARGDRHGARHSAGHVEGAAVPGEGPAADRPGGIRGRVGVMSEEKFEEFLQRAARRRTTSRPTASRATRCSRPSRRREPAPEAGSQVSTVGAFRASIPRPRWMGMAATLVIGVAIGRYALSARRDAGPGAAPMVARRPTARSPPGGAGARHRRAPTRSPRIRTRGRAARSSRRAEALLTAYGALDRRARAWTGSCPTWARDILSEHAAAARLAGGPRSRPPPAAAGSRTRARADGTALAGGGSAADASTVDRSHRIAPKCSRGCARRCPQGATTESEPEKCTCTL